MIYLDNAASTRCDDLVVDVMLGYFKDHYANAGNITNNFGIEANKAVVRSRNTVAGLLGCLPQRIIWTAGATEANNMAIFGAFRHIQKNRAGERLHIIASSIEHKSVLEPLLYLQREGAELTLIDPDVYGHTSVSQIIDSINESTVLICFMLANNELGVINDVAELAEYCNSRDIYLHCDATQGVGKVKISLQDLQVSSLSFSGHKFHGPKGIGCLFIRDEVRMDPFILGGGQENGLRSGTLNVPGIVGLSKALSLAHEYMIDDARNVELLRNKLESILIGNDNRIKINGLERLRLPNISNVSFPIRPGGNLLEDITEHAIVACSSGSACDTADNRPSHVMKALGKSRHEAKNTLRFSLSRYTTLEDIEQATFHILELFKRIKY